MRVAFGFFIFPFVSVSGSFLLQMDEEFSNCGKALFSGNFKVLRKVESPWKTHIYIEKYERGKWHIAIVDKKVNDFCQSIQDPKQIWYRFTSRLKHKNCPFEAGYVEAFENLKVGKLPDYFSYALLGRYRSTWSFDLPDGSGKLQNQCVRIGFEIVQR